MKDSEELSDKLTIEQIDEMDDRWYEEIKKTIQVGLRKIFLKQEDEMAELLGFKTKDNWIRVTEAARIIKVDKGTVTRWANEHLIEDNVETGRNRRLRLSSVLLLKYMREQNTRQKDVEDVLRDTENKIPYLH